MVSSASSQIEASACCFSFIHSKADIDVLSGTAGGNNLKTNIYVDGQVQSVADYATVQGIFIGTVAAYVILVTIFGPEYDLLFSRDSHVDSRVCMLVQHRHHSSHFEKHKTAFEEGGGQDDAIMEGGRLDSLDGREDDEKVSDV